MFKKIMLPIGTGLIGGLIWGLITMGGVLLINFPTLSFTKTILAMVVVGGLLTIILFEFIAVHWENIDSRPVLDLVLTILFMSIGFFPPLFVMR